MSEVAKETFKKTINKLFSQRFEDMKEEKDYIELLKICKNIEGLPVHHWLILKALEVIFIDKDNFKDEIDSKAVKFFDYLIDKKTYAKNIHFQNDFIKFINHYDYEGIFESLQVSVKERQIIEFICEIAKDSEILFYCFDKIYSLKIPNYVPSQSKFIFTGNYKDLLNQLKQILQYHDFDVGKEYFSLEFENKDELTFQYYSYEEANSLRKATDNTTNIKDIKKFILKNSIVKSNPQNEEPKKQSSFQEDQNESAQKKENEKTKDDHIQTANIDFELDKENEIIDTNEKNKENEKIDINDENKEKEIMDTKDIKIDLNREANLIKYIKDELKKDFESQKMQYKQEIISLKNEIIKMKEENDSIKKDNIKIKEEYDSIKKDNIKIKAEYDSIEKENKVSKKLYDDKIQRLKRNHQNDIIFLERQLLAKEKNNESSKINSNE